MTDVEWFSQAGKAYALTETKREGYQKWDEEYQNYELSMDLCGID